MPLLAVLPQVDITGADIRLRSGFIQAARWPLTCTGSGTFETNSSSNFVRTRISLDYNRFTGAPVATAAGSACNVGSFRIDTSDMWCGWVVDLLVRASERAGALWHPLLCACVCPAARSALPMRASRSQRRRTPQAWAAPTTIAETLCSSITAALELYVRSSANELFEQMELAQLAVPGMAPPYDFLAADAGFTARPELVQPGGGGGSGQSYVRATLHGSLISTLAPVAQMPFPPPELPSRAPTGGRMLTAALSAYSCARPTQPHPPPPVWRVHDRRCRLLFCLFLYRPLGRGTLVCDRCLSSSFTAFTPAFTAFHHLSPPFTAFHW